MALRTCFFGIQIIFKWFLFVLMFLHVQKLNEILFGWQKMFANSRCSSDKNWYYVIFWWIWLKIFDFVVILWIWLEQLDELCNERDLHLFDKLQAFQTFVGDNLQFKITCISRYLKVSEIQISWKNYEVFSRNFENNKFWWKFILKL